MLKSVKLCHWVHFVVESISQLSRLKVAAHVCYPGCRLPITNHLTLRCGFDFQKDRAIANQNCLNANYRFGFGIWYDKLAILWGFNRLYYLDLWSIWISQWVLCTYVYTLLLYADIWCKEESKLLRSAYLRIHFRKS